MHAPARIPTVLVLAGLFATGIAPALAATSRGTFDRPPYLHGTAKADVRPVGHVTVAFRTEPGSLDPTPERSPALAALLDSLRTEIGRLGLTRPLAVDARLAGAPDVRFGCRRGGVDTDGAMLAPSEIDTRPPRRMAFEVEGPSRAWRERVRAAAGDSVRGVVSLQLGFDEYWVRQKELRGSKTIDLGTGRAQPVAWLTSLDDPVQVLQVTGALVSPEGKVLRLGAEALGTRRTGMAASVLGAQEVLTEADLRALLEPDPGAEAVWRLALQALVKGLLEPGPR